jgi:hypothetical protein
LRSSKETSMPIDHDKLRELANTLTEDQRRLLREGLAGGADPDPDELHATLQSFDRETVHALAAADAGDAGAGDAGAGAGGTAPPVTEPPLTRW